MDSKFFVSYETARLLKEKGYNEECTTLYDCVFNEIIPAISVGLYRNECIKNDCYCSCPTKAEAIDWLDSKGIIIELSVTHDLCHWVFSIYMKGEEDIFTNTDFDFEAFQTRLEAEEAAIIKALELL